MKKREGQHDPISKNAFNQYAEDGIIHEDGSVDWLRHDGTVEEHDSRIHTI